MSTYALQTKTMLESVSDQPLRLLGVATKREDARPLLPSKRKREALCGLGTFNKPFTIKPYLDAPHDKLVILKPVRVIGRSQLPLTFLDTSPDEHFAANSLFTAHIDILEHQDTTQGNETSSPRVLIARHDTKRSLYAIERVRSRVYSICRLAGWIKEKEVADLWDPSKLLACHDTAKSHTITAEGGQWWQHAVLDTEPEAQPGKRARLSMMRRKVAPAPNKEESSPRFDSPAQQDVAIPSLTDVPLPEETPTQLPSPQEQLELLIQQYLDAVYLSKMSLAYLAKGPLTRIRNAFTSPEDDAPPTYELVGALRAMLLSPKASEKKYYEKLPAIIKALPPGNFSDDEAATTAVKVRKSKKKMKLSREGVYPHEEAAIRKWWNSDIPSGENANGETIDQRIKRRTGDLRVRETLAQLILMLEIVALEALSTYKPAPAAEQTLDKTQPQAEPQVQPKRRKKKLDDVALQLDLLLDRLCIWHATEEAGILDFDSKPAPVFDDGSGAGKSSGSDRLRDFCVEVIIPFYMNRLPEQALMVNKKLGGPAHTSPPKRKAMKPPGTSRKSGEPKEPEKKKSRRSLARVATENITRGSDRVTPSLSRSATDSNIFTRIKREGSEVALSAIPFQRSPSKNARRSVSQFRHLEGRELDLTTPSAAVTAKLKQKQRVEEQLQEAIGTLKKPNRDLAAGGYVDELERRGLGSMNRSRKQTNPVRKVVKDIQVTATPRAGRRTRDMVEQTPHHHHGVSNPFAQLSTAQGPRSQDFCIPSSGARQRSPVIPGTIKRSATGRNLAYSSIAETPSKTPTAQIFDSGAARRTIFATPLKPAVALPDSSFPTASHIFKSPAKVIGSSPPNNSADTAQSAVFATPSKPVAVSGTRSISAPVSKAAETDDIYAALGWDDDDDL